MRKADEIQHFLLSFRTDEGSIAMKRYFKCGKGQYSENDQFIGLKTSALRPMLKSIARDIPLPEIATLLQSPWHEIRFCALLLLVRAMRDNLPRRRSVGNPSARDTIARFYLAHAPQVNNWDLVDYSAPDIIGNWLLHGNPADRATLDTLSHSDNLWEQRISVVSTLMLIRAGQFDDTLRIALTLLPHNHDLIHKAVGWMLREVGKRDTEVLRSFLAAHSARMSRTTLRYAIERMRGEERSYWLRRDKRH